MRRAGIVIALLFGTATLTRGQELRPILYTDWGRLCSVGLAEAKPVCLPGSRHHDDVAWSPDGRRFVEAGGLLRDARGRRLGALSRWSGIRPMWAPDGHVFAIDYGLGSAIIRWNADGKTRRVIPVRGGEGKARQFQMLSFSPSGRRAALLTRAFREMLIADVGADSFTVVATLPAGFSYVSQSVWLAEDTLLYVGKRGAGDGPGLLWRLAISSGVVDSIGIPGLALRDQVVLAPDRGSVVVTAAALTGEVRWNLWHYDLRSGTVRRLTSGTEDIVQSWR